MFCHLDILLSESQLACLLSMSSHLLFPMCMWQIFRALFLVFPVAFVKGDVQYCTKVLQQHNLLVKGNAVLHSAHYNVKLIHVLFDLVVTELFLS